MLHYANVEQFTAMLRSGKRPDGSAVDKAMPFESLRELDDTDARALQDEGVEFSRIPWAPRRNS